MPRVLLLLSAIAAAGLLAVRDAPPAPAQQVGISVVFLDVGQGDSAMLRTGDGHNVLVDGGPPEAGPTVVAILGRVGVTSLDAVVATHPDDDHTGGLTTVVESIPVERYIHNGQAPTTQTYRRLATAVAARGIPTAVARAGDVYPFGCCVTASVLHPAEPVGSDTNNASIVLRVSFDTLDFLLTGDVEASAERKIMTRIPPLQSEILKVSHHGSKSASSAEFLAAVAPEVAVISVGRNPWGHPHQEVLVRLRGVGAETYRTDRNGWVSVADGEGTYSVGAATPYPYQVFAPWLTAVGH